MVYKYNNDFGFFLLLIELSCSVLNYNCIYLLFLLGGDRRAQSLHSILSQTPTNQRGDGGLDHSWQGTVTTLSKKYKYLVVSWQHGT